MNEIPLPAIIRLCALYQLLCGLQESGVAQISSAELGLRLGIGAHNVRKDISFLGFTGFGGAGYDVARLRELIAGYFGFSREKKICVVGLGRLGSALMQYSRLANGEFSIVAGFDSNINKLETLSTSVNLFPAYQISEVVSRLQIELGIIAVPATAAQDVADRLMAGGITGIINLAPTVIRSQEGVFIRNIDITGELRILSALVGIRTGS